MPVTDLLTRVTDSTTGRPVISALAAPKAIGAATVSLTDVTNWTTTTAIHFAIYETTAAGIKDPTTQTDWKGTLSGTTVSNLAITGGTDRAYSTGAKVELTPTARFGKDLYDWGINHANQDGTLKTSAVQAALNIAATSTDWTPLANTPTLASSAGQREHVLQFTGVDYTDRLQAGTKLKIPRTGTTPTTSMAFVAASSQYASKTSPTGITFTDDFTCEAWVYLDSYGDSGIIGRSNNSNSGFQFRATAAGGLAIQVLNTDGTNKIYDTYQSVPLSKWTHVAVATDISGSSVLFYIDGVNVPGKVQSSSGAATTLTQAGDLVVGRLGSATGYFNGKIANARVWSTLRTAAQIRDNMNQETPASTTGLVAHFKGNGSWNDSSSNANHLTAVGGAVNNSATHPYSATEYAIVTKTEYTGGNTAVTVFTGSNCLPNETLGTASYSSARAPYGFPTQQDKWKLTCHNRIYMAYNAGLAGGVWTTGNIALTVPVGVWKLNMAGVMYHTGPLQPMGGAATLSDSTSVEKPAIMSRAFAYIDKVSAFYSPLSQNGAITASSLTEVHLLMYRQNTNTTGMGIDGSVQPTVLTAECAYL